MISNADKQVNDEMIAINTIEERKLRHNTPSKTTHQSNIHIGDNVFLKEDKYKLRASEPYKVMDTFSEDNEQWATIQKHNSQFRSKKYEV